MYQQLSLFSFCVPQMIFKCVSWWSLFPVRKQEDSWDNNSAWQERGEMVFHPLQLCRLPWVQGPHFPWNLPISSWGFSHKTRETQEAPLNQALGSRPGERPACQQSGCRTTCAGHPMGLTPCKAPPTPVPLIDITTWLAEDRWSFLAISECWEESCTWVLPSLSF